MNANISDLLNTELAKLQSEIISNAKAAGKQVTGKTLNSLEHVIVVQGASIHGQIKAAPYFNTLETGRGPAKGSSSPGSDFLQNLREWIKAKGLSVRSDAEAERLAKFFKWRINKFGTELYQKGGRKDIITPAIENFEKQIEHKVTSFYKAQIISNL